MNHNNLLSKLHGALLFVILLCGFSSIRAQDFVTKWTFPSATTQIKFKALTEGGSVEYTWNTASNSGNGEFTMTNAGEVTLSGLVIAANQTVTLSMRPSNLRRFYIGGGLNRLNLIEVAQWGAVPWSSMRSAFEGCRNMQITATDAPNLNNVTDMSAMFLGAAKFNEPIGHWNTSKVKNMSGMFVGAHSFNQPIGNWNTGNVTDMSYMFQYVTSFNQPIGNWNTANVTDMSSMFSGTQNFNQPIGNWNTAKVTDMSYMFSSAKRFNQPLDNWNTSKVTVMTWMFNGAASFNQDIGNWSLSAIFPFYLSKIFSNSGIDCSNYSATLIGWRANNPSKMNITLEADGCPYGNNAIAARSELINIQKWTITGDVPTGFDCNNATEYFTTKWIVPIATTTITFDALTEGGPVNYFWTAMPSGKSGTGSFTKSTPGQVTLTGLNIAAGDRVMLHMAPGNLRRFFMEFGNPRLRAVTQWSTVPWSSMNSAFANCENFQIEATDAPNLGNVTDMSFMFDGATSFNSDIGHWNTANVTNTGGMFSNAINFNQDISHWNTANVTNMGAMFANATQFNQSIGAWNTEHVEDMSFMFFGATNFNKHIGNWSISNVRDMSSMFENAASFNQPIGNWSTDNVLFMNSMFRGARNFNQNIANWNTSNVFDMERMFFDAENFNQNIGNWALSSINTSGLVEMLTNSGMDCAHYSATLKGWRANNPSVTGIQLGAKNRKYGTNADQARKELIFDQAWVIDGDSPSGTGCDLPVVDFVTKWKYSSESTEIKFKALTAGGAVDYTLFTSSGEFQGSFTMETPGEVTLSGLKILPGETVVLHLKPGNLRRFFIDNGPHRSNLRDLSQWGSVPWSSMRTAFKGCVNLSITAADLPNLEQVTDMRSMFEAALGFNNDIGNWNTVNVTDMHRMFKGAKMFNQDISNWSTAKVQDMGFMFESATDFNQPIGGWNTAQVTNMERMFEGAKKFNQPVGNWNTAQVTTMQGMFLKAANFNQAIGNWNTAQVVDMSLMFAEAINFNQAIGNWNTANVIDMSGMFLGASLFNQAIGNWNTANVSYMFSMFEGASSFNQAIGNWNTAQVYDMASMFRGAATFNQAIGQWNTHKVYYMNNMFEGATNFNQNIGQWNTSNVIFMGSMFENATSFDQPLDQWKTAQVTDMSRMFLSASSFNQNIGSWSLIGILSPGLDDMLSHSGMDCFHYSATLIGWSENNPSVTFLTLGAEGRQYGTNAELARIILTGGRGWFINGDSNSGSPCDGSAQGFITKWVFPSGTTEIKFNAQTTGGPVSYTLKTLSGTYNGSFNMTTPGEVVLTGLIITANEVVTLEMAPNNLRRFFINSGPHRSNLRAVSKWGTVPWSSMKQAFAGCNNFTITATDVPNLNNVADMSLMFQGASNFNQPIGHWNTIQVNDMRSMFQGASSFNQPIGNWNTGKVNTMESMFLGASSFNQPIGNWNTGNVTDMSFMFLGASSFNQPIGNWNTGNVTDMSVMFFMAVNFNQYINDWNTSKVVLMNGMFANATSFNQNIGNWDLSSIEPLLGLDGMLSFCGMNCANYSATLIGWQAGNSTINGVILGADGRQYGSNAASARKELEFLQEWIIQGDAYIDTECLQEQGEPLSGTIPSNMAIAILEKEQSGADVSTEANDYQELSQPEFKVFPNPSSSSNILHITVTGVELSPEASLQLKDMQGRIILQQTLSNQTDLQLNLLPAGLYLLEAKDGQSVWRERVVVTQ